ncbi:MAG TPA: metalloregulator ArsR/SmtB family transcription factor [Micromonosporaceae bacterium]|nr:metalloregulator ArsR/SmtB family transcription factor [Micromonosporaceae bacterium]
MVKGYSTPLDLTFAALADPTRRSIVARLAMGPRTVTQLAAPLPMSLVATSKHIAVLERAGLVSRARSGRSQVCRLHAEALGEATAWLDAYRRFWAGRLDGGDRHLATEEM